MTLLVTRPEPQASAWAKRLREQGVDAQALPLIAIGPPPQPTDVARLWHELRDHRALMFVSPAAVDWFFRLRPDGIGWPGDTLAAAPGPGTAEALLDAGRACGLRRAQVLTPADTATQFDSEALWPVLAPLDWQDRRVAIVSGGEQQGASGRTWLSEQWRQRGASVHAIQAYQRTPTGWTPAQQALARAALDAPERHTWLISSSQALDFLLQHHLPGLRAPSVPAQDLRLLCTHPRIAAHAQALGAADPQLCAPTLSAVVQARRSAP